MFVFSDSVTSSSTPPTPVGSSNLPMPSHSRPSWRPSRSLCPIGGFAESGGALERAAARVCREAGARVTTHTLLSDLNVPSVDRFDNRRIEVIANGLPLHHGAQLAVDTALASPLTSAGQPRQRRGDFTAAALAGARRAKERAYPELLRGGRCKLVGRGTMEH